MLGLHLKQSGFSLLELLVVLVLMGAISSIALPNLTRLYESISRASEVREVVAQINLLGKRAHTNRTSFFLTENLIELPDGWKIEVLDEIKYSASGFCSGGRIAIEQGDDKILESLLHKPFCQVVDYEK